VSPKKPFLEIRIRPTSEQKAAIEKAANAASPAGTWSVNQWVLAACEEKLARERDQPDKKGGKR
jgi:hypothetical protein